MKTGYIRFTETNTIAVKLENGTVLMTANEIADLFGIQVSAINKNLNEIFKKNLLTENKATKEHRYTCPKHGECIRVYYNLVVIIFLSFRIETPYTNLLREWIFRIIHGQEKNDKIHNDFIMCHLETNEYLQLSLN